MDKLRLPDCIVGIDVETTALDPRQGAIIEVSAIRFSLSQDQAGHLQGEEIGEYSTLTKPHQPLSTEITAITGITAEMVAHKPNFAAVKDELQAFISESLLFAHNASFDVGFLTHHGLDLKRNPVWDTFTLAGVAWPEAESYNLGMLAEAAGLRVSGEHRAGSDVRLTWQLLRKIHEQLTVSPPALATIRRLLTGSRLAHYIPLFRTVSGPAPEAPAMLKKKDKPVGRQTLDELFSARGSLAAALPHWQQRPEQVAMAQAVAGIMQKGSIGLIEAGPGIGKTYAYLVPVIQYVEDSPRPHGAIIATYTRNLQDQLIDHDLPNVQRTLGTSLRIAALKGRKNYLCSARLKQAQKAASAALNQERAWLLVKLLAWLDRGGSGDLDRINTSHQAAHILTHLHADSLSCRAVCAKETESEGGCPYQRARRAAMAADIIVVNHALFVQPGADTTLLSRKHLIVDEAHHLEESAREATRIDFSEHRLAELIAPVVRRASSASETAHGRPADSRSEPITREANDLLADFRQFRAAIAAFMDNVSPTGRIRLTDSARRHTGWRSVARLADGLRSRQAFLAGLLTASPEYAHGLLPDALRELERFILELERFIHGSSERIQWLEKSGNDIQLNDVALAVQPAVNRLMHTVASATLTSATMTIGGKFDYISSRLGIPAAATLRVTSSFDYKQQMLLYCVDDGPEPTQADYDLYVARHISHIAQLLSGRLLGLFTSHEAVRSVYRLTLPKLHKANIRLMAQGITGGRHALTSRFKAITSSVLLGTYSFWEGIDIPGDSLSCVVIAKLPFPSPDDPVLNALAESEGKDFFTDLVIPHMVLRLRQGVGRLIRSSTDRGAVIILDGRFLTASYGDLVLKSLPPATIHIGSQQNVHSWFTNWFGYSTLQQWQAEIHHR